MLTKDQQQERNRAGVRKWYGENRDDYNALRRERYANSPKSQELARGRAARYRAEKKPIERKLYRDLNGKSVRVYSTGEVAQAMDRTPQMLRNWERADMIPASSFDDKHRLYTLRQLKLVSKLGSVIQENGGGWAGPRVKAKIRHVHKVW
jgi:hypothetical protein